MKRILLFSFLISSVFSFVPGMGIEIAMADGMYGLFMVVKGDVQVIKANNAAAPVKVGSKIFPGETVISAADSRAKIVMSDRNVLNISPGTKLTIEKYENDPKAGTKNVELNLTEGKARTNVEQKYDGEKSKFQIKTPTAVAGVRGTQFMISYSAATQATQVVTLRGSVTFSPVSAQGKISEAVTVKKGESTSVTAGATVAEPPKAIPKEELKKIDKETSAQTAPPKESTKPSETKKVTENSTETSKDRAPATQDGSSAGVKEVASVTPKDSSPGASAPAAPAPTVGMIDRKDLDIGMAKEIKVPVAAGPVIPTTVLPPPPPMKPPTVSPVVDDLIKGIYDRTKVTIVPVVN